MSLQALNWAMVQKCGSPSAKMVLIILSRFASAEGWAWPSRQTLAEATEQSPDSVDRALRLLIERGFIEKGERQVRHDGGDSSVRYRLLFDIRRAEADLQQNHIRPRVRHKERPDQGEQPELTRTDPVPQIAAGGGGVGEPPTVPQDAAGGAANLRQGGAADCGTSPERKESKIRISPLAPPAGGDVRASNLDSGKGPGQSRTAGELDPEPASAIEQGLAPRDRRGSRPGRRGAPPATLTPDAEARYRQLTTTYPADGVRSARLTDAQAAFAQLTPAEQAHAIREAAAYAELCRRRDQRPKALQTWLRHGFDRSGARPDGTPAPVTDLAATKNAEGMRQAERGIWPTGCSILVLADSAEGAAWEAYFQPFGVKPRWMQLTAGLGAYLPSKTPPARSAA